jgi:hypothetical protein
MRKNKLLLLVAASLSSIIFAGILITSAGSEDRLYEKQKMHLVNKINNSNEELKYDSIYELGDISGNNKKKLVKFHDSKYYYSLADDTGEVQIINPISLDDSLIMANGNIDKSLAIQKAKAFVDKFDDKDVNTKEYNLQEYKRKVDCPYDVHTITLEGIANNGIKTGDTIVVWVNQQGELVMYAKHNGNAAIAINTKPVLSEKQAAQIASDDIIKNNNFLKEKYNNGINATKVELTVFNDRLVYRIDFSNVFKRFGELDISYYYLVDSSNGQVVLVDYTK